MHCIHHRIFSHTGDYDKSGLRGWTSCASLTYQRILLRKSWESRECSRGNCAPRATSISDTLVCLFFDPNCNTVRFLYWVSIRASWFRRISAVAISPPRVMRFCLVYRAPWCWSICQQCCELPYVVGDSGHRIPHQGLPRWPSEP